MSNHVQHDPSLAAITTAGMAHVAVRHENKRIQAEGIPTENQDALLKPFHDASAAADETVIAACPTTLRGFAEKAQYLAELAIGTELGTELGVGLSFNEVTERVGALGAMTMVAAIARDAETMIGAGECKDRDKPEDKICGQHWQDFEADLRTLEGIVRAMDGVGLSLDSESDRRAVIYLAEQGIDFHDRLYCQFEAWLRERQGEVA